MKFGYFWNNTIRKFRKDYSNWLITDDKAAKDIHEQLLVLK